MINGGLRSSESGQGMMMDGVSISHPSIIIVPSQTSFGISSLPQHNQEGEVGEDNIQRRILEPKGRDGRRIETMEDHNNSSGKR
jgi:hypothetical protein